MCLAVPGKIIALKDIDDSGVGRAGTVDFQGNRVDVSLALVPEATEGSWVLVHAGFALNVIDERDARETWKWLEEAKIVDDIPEELKGTGEGQTQNGNAP